MRKKRTKITVETERLLFISKTGSLIRVWCAECGEQVEMITPEEAAIAAHVNSRTIYQWVEAKQLHFTETPAGLLLICLNSLAPDRQS